jgi:2-polyprenyl-6-methoxyphenol hydroxylase-like FAD-dependent oxidoreductase
MNPDVLIVGAGPSGLALACYLANKGVSVRIIDKNSARSDKSKALGVQAGTLESLDAAFGPELSQEMRAHGWPAREMWAHLDDKDPVRVDLSGIPSRYDFILILEQSETERILEKWLNTHSVFVERETELLALQQTQGEVISLLRGPQGADEVTSRFIAGCDGAHSTVRGLLQIPFQGKTYHGDFILGDVQIDWPAQSEWAMGVVRNFVSDRGVMICFPMKGATHETNRYRLILVPQTQTATQSSYIELEEFRKIAASLCPAPIQITNATWLTRFRIQQRMTSRYREGRAFLVGDAAHIHNPAGGQGMNTGIQDAFNLGDKLARVLQGGAELATLDRYEAERRPVARAVLRGTDAIFGLALVQRRKLMKWVRGNILARVVQTGWIQRRVLTAVSQVKIARREIADRAR